MLRASERDPGCLGIGFDLGQKSDGHDHAAYHCSYRSFARWRWFLWAGTVVVNLRALARNTTSDALFRFRRPHCLLASYDLRMTPLGRSQSLRHTLADNYDCQPCGRPGRVQRLIAQYADHDVRPAGDACPLRPRHARSASMNAVGLYITDRKEKARAGGARRLADLLSH